MILNIGEDDYLPSIGGPSGIRVIVHPQSTMPHPESDGNLAKPGELTSIGIKRVGVYYIASSQRRITHQKCHKNMEWLSK